MTITAETTAAAVLEGYVVLDAEQERQVEYLRAARANEKGWKVRKDTLTAGLKNLLAGAKGAVTADGTVLVELSTRAGRKKVDLDLLAAKYPEAYAECVSAGEPQTVLSLK